ncbi:MAG TPA: type II toxin-antitoxin system prevent-host-death family antitoxin [Vicinamibacterales bacterium]|jgi:prevent-host-death family protein
MIGVRELKAHLSEYLKRVEAGEQLTVAHRGRPIATIVPATAGPKIEWVRAMVAEGRAQWNGGKPRGLTPRLKSRGKPASRMVIEDRG